MPEEQPNYCEYCAGGFTPATKEVHYQTHAKRNFVTYTCDGHAQLAKERRLLGPEILITEIRDLNLPK